MKLLLKPIIRYPYVAMAFILGLTIFFGYSIKYLHIDNDLNRMIPEDHPVKIAQHMIEKEFGTAEMVMVGFVTDNIFTKDFLTKVKKLSKQLKKLKIESDPFINPVSGELITKDKKCIENVISLSTIPYVEGTEFGIETSKLMEKVPENNKEIEQLKEKVFSWDMYKRILVSSDSKATLIAIEYKSSLSYEERIRMVDVVRRKLDDIEFGAGVEIYVAGLPFLTSMICKNMADDIAKLLPAVFFVVICILWIAMKKLSNVVLIFTSIAISVVWTMGLMPVLGYNVTLISSSIPILLVAVGSAYGIHIINHYTDEVAEGKNTVTAIENTIGIVGVSVFAAALTTMVGFMSLMTSRIEPIKEFGLFAGIGAGVSFIVTVIFIPATLIITNRIFRKTANDYKIKKRKTNIDLVPFLQKQAFTSKKYHKTVITISIIIMIGAFLISLRIYSDTSPIKNFKKNSEIRKAEALLNDKFMGMTTMVITLEADKDDYFKYPEPLQKLDRFKTFVENIPEVGMVDVLSEYIKRMNYAMNANQKVFDSVPAKKEMISQYLLLYSNPDDLSGVVTSDFRKVRLVIYLKDGSVNLVSRLNTACGNWLHTEFSGLKITFGGETQLGVATNDLVIKGQIYSLFFSVVVVFIISMIIFRSFFGGFLAIVPLCISILLNFCILGLFRIPLDVGTALIACIGIGIGVDYSIHFINGVKHGMDMKGFKSACDGGIKITGNAIVFNAVSVACGFLILTFSSFVPLIKLGGFVAFTMVSASLCTLFILPAWIITMKPSFLKK